MLYEFVETYREAIIAKTRTYLTNAEAGCERNMIGRGPRRHGPHRRAMGHSGAALTEASRCVAIDGDVRGAIRATC